MVQRTKRLETKSDAYYENRADAVAISKARGCGGVRTVLLAGKKYYAVCDHKAPKRGWENLDEKPISGIATLPGGGLVTGSFSGKSLGRPIGGVSDFDGDGDGLTSNAAGEDIVPVVAKNTLDSVESVVDSFKQGKNPPKKFDIPDSWFQSKTYKEQFRKRFPNGHMRFDEKRKMYYPSTGTLKSDAVGYDLLQDGNIASNYLSRKHWHHAYVDPKTDLGNAMRLWRGGFAESRAIARALNNSEPTQIAEGDSLIKKATSNLRDGLDNASSINIPSYRTTYITPELGGDGNVGSVLNFGAASVALDPNTALGFEDDLLAQAGVGVKKTLFEFPPSARGLLFDEVGEAQLGNRSATGGENYPQEGIVTGKYRVARIEKREFTDPLSKNKKVTRDVHILENVTEKSLEEKGFVNFVSRSTDPDTFSDPESARIRSRNLGCIGIRRYTARDGKLVWLPCTNVSDYNRVTGIRGDNSPRNNPRRQGAGFGKKDAQSSTAQTGLMSFKGVPKPKKKPPTVTSGDINDLAVRVRNNNAKAKSTAKTNLRDLKIVFLRGLEDGSKDVAKKRVYKFLALLNSDKPADVKYFDDNDLLPLDHPWRNRKTSKKWVGFQEGEYGIRYSKGCCPRVVKRHYSNSLTF
jgi:hypothetical protein